MDYEKISQAAQAACKEQIQYAILNKSQITDQQEQQAKVFTAGVVAALKEYDHQKEV